MNSFAVCMSYERQAWVFKVSCESFRRLLFILSNVRVQKGSVLIHRARGCRVFKPPFSRPITQRREKCPGSARRVPLRLPVIPLKNLTSIKKEKERETENRGSLSLLCGGRCHTNLALAYRRAQQLAETDYFAKQVSITAKFSYTTYQGHKMGM